ncbi:MAG: ATP-binding protein [Planctomycetaceae bacterium]|nr:ATP-binding protein [Planctomycetaceae bacterium]
MLIESSSGNTRGPVYTESLLRTIHVANHRRLPVFLMFTTTPSGATLAVDCPHELRTLILQELQDAYPGTNVQPAPEDVGDSHEISLSLFKTCDVFPITDFPQFMDNTDERQLADPVAGILSALRTTLGRRVRCSVQIEIRPASQRRIRSAQKMRGVLQRGFRTAPLQDFYVQLTRSDRALLRALGHVLPWLFRPAKTPTSQHGQYASELPTESLFECRVILTARSPADIAYIAEKRLQEIAGTLGRFNNSRVQLITASTRKHRAFLMSARELATIWHPLTASGDAVARVRRSEFREIEPPMALTSKKGSRDETILGRVRFRNQRNLFGIAMDDLRRHMIAVGKTGCGKSTFLLNIVRQQAGAGRGVILVDPHGQLAEDALRMIPQRRTNDTIYFDASDRVNPKGFNPMVGPPGADPTLIADGVLTSFKNVFGFDDGSAPRLLHIFRNCLLSLIGTPHASLAGVQRILVDANHRRSVVAQVRNEAVREFWLTEFNRWNERDRTQYIASLQNKLGAFTTNERLQKILAGDRKGIQLRQVMDRSRILICNLSKGTVGHDASTLLGSLLLSSLQIAAMSRADVPESERPDCVVVIDEFHSYLSEGNLTMADALAESRKYRTSYVLSTQMLEQLDHATLTGVLGNCGSTLCMTVGPRDATILADLLGHGLTPEDLMRIPKYHAYLKMLIAGTPNTFSMMTLPPSLRTR